MNENSNAVKRREWVKNAAIIFLSVMLVLTFFSNTIMNYSLPEVATQYAQSGTISEKVRGTGNIEASDPYNVSIGESRVISSVAIKAGDTVSKGDVIFYLEDEESTELTDAQQELNTLILAYQVAVITESLGVGTVSNIENENTLTLSQKQQKLQATIAALDVAQAEFDAATLQVAEINKQIGHLGNVVADTSGEKNALSNAQKEASSAGQAVTNAQTNKDKAKANITIAENNLVAKKTESENANNAVTAMQTLKTTIDNYSTQKSETEQKVSSLQSSVADLEVAYENWKANNPNAGPAEWEAQKKSLDEAKQNLADAEAAIPALDQAYQDSLTAYQTAGGEQGLQPLISNAAIIENEKAQLEQEIVNAMNKASELEKELANKQGEESNKNAAVNNAQQALENKQNSVDVTVDKANASNLLLNAEDRKTKAQTALDKATEEMDTVQKELLAEISLESQNEAIQLQLDKIQKLEEKSVGAAIEAPVDGIVTTLNLVAGEKTKPDEALAVIQVAGKGFTLSFSATTEQAKKLSIGDMGEVQNSWYYEDVKATLVSIKPDPEEPAQKKLLTFNVEGDVQAGQSISLSVGQKSSNYEMTVPNSAIREDSNGKFVLMVEIKSSPLGNRYIATRVDVEVLAADDTHTAISAGLYNYDYVITTATKPVEAGKHVRLTD